jgi:hypothetical protein
VCVCVCVRKRQACVYDYTFLVQFAPEMWHKPYCVCVQSYGWVCASICCQDVCPLPAYYEGVCMRVYVYHGIIESVDYK